MPLILDGGQRRSGTSRARRAGNRSRSAPGPSRSWRSPGRPARVALRQPRRNASARA